MLIYLIRHARPEGIEGVCYGRQDVPVSAAATARAALAVRAQLPTQILATAPLYTSPLIRCTLLARALTVAQPPVISPELLELDFGTWEGSAWNDIPRTELDCWAQDPWHYSPGGAESASRVAARFRRWLEHLRERRLETVVAVTHAGLIRVALASGSAEPRGLSLPIPYGSVHRVTAGETGVAQSRRTASCAP
jgi:alpha-ribazole phosphatase